jgi:hypothetical protein
MLVHVVGCGMLIWKKQLYAKEQCPTNTVREELMHVPMLCDDHSDPGWNQVMADRRADACWIERLNLNILLAFWNSFHSSN